MASLVKWRIQSANVRLGQKNLVSLNNREKIDQRIWTDTEIVGISTKEVIFLSLEI